MSIGTRIRQLREKHGLTQKQLGEIAGVSDKAVSTWEQGTKTPRMAAVQKMADYFGISKAALLDGEPPRDDRFGKTFDRLCTAWGRTPQMVERDLGFSHSRLSMLRDGTALPFEDELSRLQGYFGVPAFFGSVPPEQSNVIPLVRPLSTVYRIPILGSVPAGVPVEAVTDIIDEIDLDPRMATDGYDYFALLVTGDSMIPEYRDGDVVIIRMQSSAETGDDVVAYIGNADATLKRFTRTQNGIQLRPLNTAYPVRSFTKDQILSLPVTIAGIVVEQRRIRRR